MKRGDGASRGARDVVVLGASAGGVAALCSVLSGLGPARSLRIAVVLHRSRFSADGLARVLQRHAALRVVEARDGDRFARGNVHLAPRDQHLLVDGGRLRLERGPREHSTRPAIDPTLRSAAASFGPRVVGVVLTGAGHDGLAGLLAVKAAGGLALVQDPDEAEHPSMPLQIVLHDHPDAVVRLRALPGLLASLAAGEDVAPPGRARIAR